MQTVYQAYWLLPNGNIKPVRTTHIQEIINCPEEFGETLADIMVLYDYYKEKMPHEGKARAVIMKRLFKKGYIRIRERKNHWVVELNQLSSTEKTLISEWIYVVCNELIDTNAELRIMTLYKKTFSIMTFMEYLHNICDSRSNNDLWACFNEC